MRSSLGVVAALSAQYLAHAQYTTSATCSASFGWASNQQNQSPCLVAAYVQGACGAIGKWDVLALPSLQTFYQAPLSECGCSIANYNLLSACAACQGALSPRFPYWSSNCSNANLLNTSTYYPTSSWPLPDGVQIPLWAQQDARLWTNMQFNSTEAQTIAVSGELIGLPLGSSSTTSTMTNPLSSPSNTSSAPISDSPNDGRADIGPIVGGVVGGVLGLLFIGVLIWWIMGQRWSSFEGASPSMSVVPFAGSKAPTPAQAKMVVPVPQRAFHQTYPSYTLSPSNPDSGDGSPAALVQHAPGALDYSWGFPSHPHATVGTSLNFTPMLSSTGVGLPSDTPQRMGSPSSRSMISRFVFPRRRNHRHSDAQSTMSPGSSLGQISILQSTPPNMGHPPQLLGLSPVPGQATLEPTPNIPLPQGQALSPVMSRPSMNPPGYTPPETSIPSPLPQPNPAIQAHMTPHIIRPLNTELNRMIVATPAPTSPETLDLPSYMASQAESRGEQLRQAADIATTGTGESSSHILATPSAPEIRGDPLPLVSERADSPHSDSRYPQGKV